MYSLLDPSRFVVFITGATSGFGAAAARRYVAAGGKVIATGRREDRLLALRDELGHDNCHIIPLDVRDRAAMEAAIALPWTNGQIERIDRTIKGAAVKRRRPADAGLHRPLRPASRQQGVVALRRAP